MGSKTFDGVWFIAWSEDHDPLHVHGRYADVEIVVLLHVAERRVSVRGAPKPLNAKRSSIGHILRTAQMNFDMLVTLAEDTCKRRNR